MKPINLLSLLSANRKLTPEVFNSYISHFDIKIKKSELEDLRSLVTELLGKIKEVNILERFYVGYTINQIGKEFALLRFGDNNIINIELKKEDTGDKIKEQLIKNKYYLGFLDKKVLNFTYVAEEKKLFYLDESEKLTEVEISFLISELWEQKLIEIEDIHKHFDPSNYLVSPFNSTEKFINNKYFLTDHQENIKKSILKLNRETEPCFISIEGNAGTGKTLLIYDIAKEYRNRSERVLIFHCGALNNGHIKLKNNYSWKITQSHYLKNYNFNDYNLIILDETQRIGTDEIDEILLKAKETNAMYIFSYDFQQCLASWEIKRNI
ncbi:ATP-binding protein [Peribacillus simplex]|uniref:ATP-binding protein n=1 Tax=Peribacillus simplex TaxID=1478 RepID=UPI0036D84E41